MKQIYIYNSKLKALARDLRKKSTEGEIILWNRLKKKQMRGCDFHRQKPLFEYIVDFFCPEFNLVIEIDGDESHYNKYNYDSNRQKFLEEKGIHFLRFSEKQIRKDVVSVLWVINDWIEENDVSQHTPSALG